MKKLFFLCSVIGLTVLGITSCCNVATFNYMDAPGTMARFQERGTAHKTIAVLPFLDQRSVKYYDSTQVQQSIEHSVGDHGSLYLGLIPLFPFGYIEKEEPENSEDFVSLGRCLFNFSQDLSTASCLSLKASNLFASVSKVNSLEQCQTDYVWRGKFTNTYYGGHLYSYCITYFVSPVLWVLGAPSGCSRNELGVVFELVKRDTGEVVWSYKFEGHDYIVHWIYARNGQDVSLYSRLMKQAMNAALYDLSQKMSTIEK